MNKDLIVRPLDNLHHKHYDVKDLPLMVRKRSIHLYHHQKYL